MGPLLAFDFDLGPVPARNIDHVKSLGLNGIVTRLSRPSDVPKLIDYANYVAAAPELSVYAFVNYDFNNPDSPQVWVDAIPTLAALDVPLWVLVRNAPSIAEVDAVLLGMAVDSEAAGVPMVLYPHWDTDIENADEAAVRIAQIGHSNISLSLHTCHEIRSGNQYGMRGVVAAHGANTSIVTIAGADDNAYAGPQLPTPYPWDDAIKPISLGSYSLLPFLDALKSSGYRGPMVIHTFGLAANVGHLGRSVRMYRKLLTAL